MQDEALASLYEDKPHIVHFVFSCWELYLPATQSLHEVAATDSAYFPCPHIEHKELPGLELALPTGHFVHTVARAEGAISPAWQIVQLVLASSP